MKILLKKDDVSATDVVILNLLLQFFSFMCKVNLDVGTSGREMNILHINSS